MRHQFVFLGVPTPERRRISRDALSGMARPTEADLTSLSSTLYALLEREYQYIAVDVLSANVRNCSANFLPHARLLIETKSWWDTVDGLAASVVGPLVMRHTQLRTDMDAWIADKNLWIVRTAILHQLRYKERTDVDRLFGYCERQAGHRDFFVRKAIGWALREYSKTDPDAVRSFIESHEDSLSGLSKREGLLWIVGRRRKASA